MKNRHIIPKTKLFIIAFFCLALPGVGQDKLFMPLEIQQAYAVGTRYADGKPGENYWQNKAVYNIAVEVLPEQKKLLGVEQVTYLNNSPDTLKSVWIHLYADFYKKGNARDESIALVNITEGVLIKEIKLGGKNIDVGSSQVERHTTNLQLHLDEPLLSGDSLALEMAWEEMLPAEYHNRIGAYDSTTFMVGYWYPQLAVYDDLDGWDTFAYGGIQEFYREFSDYNVEITLPEHYYVWATGKLLNADAVYPPEIKKRREAAGQSDTTVRILSGRRDYPDAGNKKKTWVYGAENVGDFAFGFSDYFLWEASSLAIDDKSGRRVMINTVFDPADQDTYTEITAKQRKMLTYLSEELPGVAYPYPHFTTFVGSPIYDGMEFPMMANNGIHRGSRPLSRFEDVEVTAHEMAHTYFPFLTGINERKYTWMEEGWAVFLTARMLEDSKWPILDEYLSSDSILIGEYLKYAGSHYEAPLLTNSILLRNTKTHRHLAYYKAFWAYAALEDMLGEETFKVCLYAFINRWAGKHPMPYDFFFTFSDVARQNLNWFWKAWFQDFAYADLGLSMTQQGELILLNPGGLPLPGVVSLTYADEEKAQHEFTAEVWKEGAEEIVIPIEKNKKLINASLRTRHWPDANHENNKLYP